MIFNIAIIVCINYFFLSVNTSDSFVLGGLIFLMIAAIACFPIRNKYIIDSDTLIVKEYDFFRLTTDLRIPLTSIGKVYLCDTFTLFPHVIIVVDGIERKLRATTHAVPLAIHLARETNPA